ncbi:MAG: ABC transporter permease subunit [Methanotrichaceae archaeon]
MIFDQILNPKGLLDAIADHSVLSAIWLTIYASLLSTLIAVLSGTPLAYILARKEFSGKWLVESLVDLPLIVPHTVAGIGLLMVFGSHGLIGSFSPVRFVDALPGIIVAMLFVSSPFFINSAREGFQSVDPRLEWVARTLGADQWSAFRRVSLPLASRHILVGAIMSWARGISEFGAVIVIAYYPMIAPTLIWDRFLTAGLSSSAPISVLLILICMTIFISLRILSKGDRG